MRPERPPDEPHALSGRLIPEQNSALYIPIMGNTHHPEDFDCPRCQARYRIARMKSEQGVAYGMVQCVVCDQLLAPTEADAILKYFLVSRPKNRSKPLRGAPPLAARPTPRL